MEPRTVQERKRDVLEKLRAEEDCWVASADAGGRTHLIPLSFYWDGVRLIVATPAGSRTARNLRRAGVAQVGLGPTRDVVIVSGSLEFLPERAVDEGFAQAHARKAVFDPRRSEGEYVYICLTPERVQAWRTEPELAGREVMREGRWLA